MHAQVNETEILTLFTTPQERDLINKNRYKKQAIKAQVVATENEEPEEEKKIEQQEILLSVRLAGVTISQSGQNIAWLNGKAFENGSKLDDGSRVFISSKVKTLVQIKTPDGKYHSVTTGETIDISYFKRIEG
ncbi:MAG: hypothetical protein HOM14_08575 [Gammaproteobacteria bacterium]|nr:hypothetical protein [Gammaproteobacteria bacterium]MBT6551394.1 hypothetical protein [Gammaproteobacteria bacterium]